MNALVDECSAVPPNGKTEAARIGGTGRTLDHIWGMGEDLGLRMLSANGNLWAHIQLILPGHIDAFVLRAESGLGCRFHKRCSAMHYKKKSLRVAQVGRELNVQYVLEGSLRKEASKIRVAAQLIRVKDETHTWARKYDRELAGLLASEGEIAQEISDEIQTARSSRPQRVQWECRVPRPVHLPALANGSNPVFLIAGATSGAARLSAFAACMLFAFVTMAAEKTVIC